MTAYVHIYPAYVIASDGETVLRVPLRDEQIVQLAADVTELAAKILRWEAQHVSTRTSERDAGGGPL